MPSVTLQDLQSRGFTQVTSAPGGRLQTWTGAKADGTSLMVLWDSVNNQAYPLPTCQGDLTPVEISRSILTLALLVDSIIGFIPVSVIDAPTKAIMRSFLNLIKQDASL